MTVYAPSDTRSISISPTRGGCGQPHTAGDLADGERFSVTCPACEPHIIAAATGWAHTPEGVHLTPDELAVVEADEARAKRERNRTWGDPQALGKAFAEVMGAQMAMPPAVSTTGPSLLEQIAALSPNEKRALSAMLAESGLADGQPDDEENGEGGGEGADDDSAEDASASERRRPGRPRKNVPPPAS